MQFEIFPQETTESSIHQLFTEQQLKVPRQHGRTNELGTAHVASAPDQTTTNHSFPIASKLFHQFCLESQSTNFQNISV